MSDLENILFELRGLGIKLFIRDDKLRYKAPKDTLTKEIKSRLHDNKNEIIKYLKETKKEVGLVGGLITQSPRDGNLPLSFAQQRLWFIDQLDEKASQAYHIPRSTKLTGILNRCALINALNRIVERHESLRTTFKIKDGVPIQVIGPPDIGFCLEEYDAGNYSDTELSKIIEEEASRSFDLSDGPLIRGQLLKKSDEEHILLITMHHIASDGWSMGIFMNELSTLYQAFNRNEPDPLPVLSIQYADFALWQRNWIKDDILQEQLSYWRDKLSGSPELLELPTDHSRPSVWDYSGSSTGIYLDADLTRSLISLSRRHEATLFMTLLAGWGVLLSRLSGQDDLTIGAPVANRTRVEIEPLIGFFVNILVLRLDFSDSPTVSELMTQVKKTTLGAQSHQDIPFEKIVEELQPERSLSHSPLFQVVFVLNNSPRGRMNIEGVSIESIGSPQAKSPSDLNLTLQQAGDVIVGDITYATALFEYDSIERYIEYFKTLLRSMVSDDNQRIYQLELLSSDELNQVLYEWNETEAGYLKDRCIHELFEEQAENSSDEIAVMHEDKEISYRELDIRSNQLAHYLIEHGVESDKPVGICMDRSIELIIGILGVLKSGGAYLPLDPDLPEGRLAYMISDSKVSITLIQEILEEKLAEYSPKVICLDNKWEDISLKDKEKPFIGISSDNLCCIIYTSGSTGIPKGVGVIHKNVNNILNGFENITFSTTEHRGTFICPFSFDVSVWEIFSNLCFGGVLHILSMDNYIHPVNLLKYLLEHRITSLYIPPSLLPGLADQIETLNECLSIYRILVGVEPIKQNTLNRFTEKIEDLQIINGYGPTETTICATLYDFDGSIATVDKNIPIGVSAPGYNTYLLDLHFNPVPVKVGGEIFVSGDGLARCYIGQPVSSAEKYIPNPFNSNYGDRLYKTGDLGRWLPDGNIEFIGRHDHQVKVRGYRIELGEIESRIREIEGIKESVAVACEEESGDKRLVGYYTLTGDIEDITADAIKKHLSMHLPDYMVPSAYMMLDEIPLTPNGKIDHKALPAPEGDAYVRGEYEAPVGEIEETLSQIWSEVLNVDKVGRHDNFFDLGGHSLLAVKLIERMRHKGLNIDIRYLFISSDLKNIADILGNKPLIAKNEVPIKYNLNQFRKKNKCSNQIDITTQVGGKI